MPDLNNIIDNTSTIPANSEPEAPSEDTSGVPSEVLELPIMRALLEGSPPALWAPQGTKGPEIATVLKHGEALNKIGIGFYRSSKSKLDLVFNTRFVDPALIKAADAKNKLKEVASPLLEVMSQINGAVGEPVGVTASAAGMPSSAPLDTPLNTARLGNLEPGAPTSGPVPGQGRVLSSLLKPTL